MAGFGLTCSFTRACQSKGLKDKHKHTPKALNQHSASPRMAHQHSAVHPQNKQPTWYMRVDVALSA